MVRDVEAREGGARRHLSRTISVTGSTAKDTIVAGRDGGRDYIEINSIPPLPLYALLSADLDNSYKGGEEGAKAPEGEGAQKSGEDQYADLFQVGGAAEVAPRRGSLWCSLVADVFMERVDQYMVLRH